jgi:protein O-GlcNAc transferase
LQFVALIAAADVALDPFPWGGGVSTLDSFAAGTPVITAPSLQTVVQLAAGMYRKMGMGQASGHCCIAADIDEYVHMAVSVAQNATMRGEASRRIAASRAKVYDDASSLVEWSDMLQRLGRSARARY